MKYINNRLVFLNLLGFLIDFCENIKKLHHLKNSHFPFTKRWALTTTKSFKCNSLRNTMSCLGVRFANRDEMKGIQYDHIYNLKQ